MFVVLKKKIMLYYNIGCISTALIMITNGKLKINNKKTLRNQTRGMLE